MEEVIAITLESIMERSMSPEEKGNRGLIAAIIDCAVNDAVSPLQQSEFRSGRSFINKNNKLFIFYCNLLDYDPDWAAKKLWKHIDKVLPQNIDKIRKNQNANEKKLAKKMLELLNSISFFSYEEYYVLSWAVSVLKQIKYNIKQFNLHRIKVETILQSL